MSLIAEVKFTNKLSTITISTETDHTTFQIETWDEWCSITLDGVLYDVHCHIDEEDVNVILYELENTDAHGIRNTMYDTAQLCTLVGDFVNDVMVWGECGDFVTVKPHDDIKYEFNGTIVSLKDETHKVIAIEDQCGDVWDCDSKYITLHK